MMASPASQADASPGILLATDLGSRCDRALDRSLFLARHWGARLVVLTVVEPGTRIPAEASPAHRHLRARNQLRRDIGDADIAVEVVVREGDVGEQVGAVAAECGCSLIITGTARNELFGRILLGSTVEQLSRSSQLPLLTVHERMHGLYERVVVASDFSASSRHALETILELLSGIRPTLFHAFDVPFLGMLESQREDLITRARADAIAQAREFLRAAGHPGLTVVAAHGDPAERLREYADTHDSDLIVIATHGRGALYKVLIGSVAQRLLESAPCDTLLVPEPQAREAS